MSYKLKIDELAADWIDAKKAEFKAAQDRRQIEDELTVLLNINPSNEGTLNYEGHEFKVKMTNRMTRKIDPDKLQEIAGESGLTDHLFTLFRWKPEIEMKAWKSADQAVTSVLSKAVTTSAGRPSYSITTEE